MARKKVFRDDPEEASFEELERVAFGEDETEIKRSLRNDPRSVPRK